MRLLNWVLYPLTLESPIERGLMWVQSVPTRLEKLGVTAQISVHAVLSSWLHSRP